MRFWQSTALLLVFPAVLSAADDSEVAENWHQWRGPHANGVAPHGDPPTEWGEKSNLMWKVRVPGRGSSAPIVWGNKVFLLTAIKTDRIDETKAKPEDQPKRPFGIRYPNAYHKFIVMCLDRRSGKTLWEQTAREAVPPEGRHGDNNYASASPTTDGKFLYASFVSNGIYCYDLEGNKQWERDLGDMKTRLSFGGGSSPVLHGDSLVVNWDHDGPSFIAVLDTKDGSTKWKQPRDEVSAWATPLVVTRDGTTQVITNASNRMRGYNLADGKVFWECGGQKFNVTPSPVATQDTVFCMSGYRGSAAFAIPLDSSGDITGTDKIAWSLGRDTPYIPSPLLYDDLLYFTKSNSGILTVAEAKTGKVVVPATRLPGLSRVYASPVAAAGKVYLQGRDGRTLVIKHGRKFEVLAENRVTDATDASPAIVGKQLFLRGSRYLYCFENR